MHMAHAPCPPPQDPYCLVSCGAQTLRSRTHQNGGKNPVWNQALK